MTAHPAWQKSTYCGEGDNCVYVSAAPGHLVRVADRADPAHLVLA
ncbi:toxin-antitoxin system, toxin component, partial [Streptomyces sp. NRRL S-444]